MKAKAKVTASTTVRKGMALGAGRQRARARSGERQSAGGQHDPDDQVALGEAQEYRKAAKKCDAAIIAELKGVPAGGYALRASIFVVEKRYEEGARSSRPPSATTRATPSSSSRRRP